MNRYRNRLLISGCSLAFLVSAAACSAETGKDAMLNACALLHQNEIAAALGRDVSPGERNDIGLITDGPEAGTYSSTCLWRVMRNGSSSASASLQDRDYVILNAMQWPADKDPAAFLQTFRDFAAQGVISHTPVSLEIGEAGLWWGDGVAVVKDQVSFGISVRLAGERERRRDLEENLAEKIVAGL